MALRRGLPLALVLVLAACGGGGSKDSQGDDATTTDANGCTTVEQPKPAARKAAKPTTGLDQSKTYTVTMQTNCGSFTIDLAVKTAPATTASFASLVRQGLLRQHDLPPDRARLHHPGRRPDRERPAAAPATRPSTSRRRRRATRSAPSRWRRRRPSRPARAAASSSSSPRRTRSCRRDYAIARRGQGRARHGRRPDRRARRRLDRAADRDRRDPEGDRLQRVTVAAVVLAAGAATRYGGPKQAEFLPAVLAALARRAVGEVVVVAGAHPLCVDSAQARVVQCDAGRTGPAPRCAAGSRRSGATSSTRSSSSRTGRSSIRGPSSG